MGTRGPSWPRALGAAFGFGAFGLSLAVPQFPIAEPGWWLSGHSSHMVGGGLTGWGPPRCPLRARGGGSSEYGKKGWVSSDGAGTSPSGRRWMMKPRRNLSPGSAGCWREPPGALALPQCRGLSIETPPLPSGALVEEGGCGGWERGCRPRSSRVPGAEPHPRVELRVHTPLSPGATGDGARGRAETRPTRFVPGR